MQNMLQPLNLASESELQKSSMFHFKLKQREMIEVFKFEGF